MRGDKKLSVRKQCELLSISPSTLYFKPRQTSAFDLYLMHMIDKKYFEKPFWGVRRMTDWLRENFFVVNHKKVERLYKLLDLKAIAPGPHTSKPNKAHRKYAYLLRNMNPNQPNEVWVTDITCIPMRTGFLYLSAIMDVYSRYIVGWSLSNTMTTEWTTQVMNDAIERFGAPKIVNTDQGTQYTSIEHTSLLMRHNIQISMDGKGRATDNIFIERFWRTLKYEHLKFKDYNTGLDLHQHIQEFMLEYNNDRKHTTIGKRPVELYFATKAA